MNKILCEVKRNLPVRRWIKLRNSGDRFGFSYMVAAKLREVSPRTFKCNWIHGWEWHQLSPETFMSGSKHYNMYAPIVVPNQVRADHYAKHFCRAPIIPGGLPFAYIGGTGLRRIPGSVVAFLPKSLKENDEHLGGRGFVRYLAANRSRYSNPIICVFGGDLHRDNLLTEIKDNGFDYIEGADPADGNSLHRMASIFDQFEFAISPTIGSFIVYAHARGCRANIVGQFAEPSVIHKQSNFEYAFVHSKYKYLFINDLGESKLMHNWAHDEIGTEFIRDYEEIRGIVGWTMKGAVRHYCLSGYSKLMHLARS